MLPTLDTVLYNVQRQGKTSFHMTSHGEEATIIGTAAALENDDEVLGQYREMGILLWRGFGINSVMAQCFGNREDTSGKGRQMPVHFGSPKHHFLTISSTLATQIPQAAGVGYALRRTPERSHSIAACFFGEGAASEGDFHAGLLLASTIPSPTLFIARNNGFAISTPSTEQYYGDGIASRGPGYGIDTPFEKRGGGRLSRPGCSGRSYDVSVCWSLSLRRPPPETLWSVGHHSTSDDSFAYRQRSEVEDRKRIDNPITRFRLWMESQGWWSSADEEELKSRQKTEVMQALKRAESLERCELGELFTDVYAGQEPWTLTEQRKELQGLLKKYGQSWEPWRAELARFKNKVRYSFPNVTKLKPITEQHIARFSTVGSGILVGTALGVIIPEGIEALNVSDKLPTSQIALSLIAGFTLMMVIEQLVAPHSQGASHFAGAVPLNHVGPSSTLEFDAEMGDHEGSSRGSTPGPGFMQADSAENPKGRAYPLTFGLVMHGLADGLALGVSALPDPTHPSHGHDLTLVVFLALIVHKAPTSLAFTTSLLNTSLSRADCRKHLGIFAASTPVGAIASYLLLSFFSAGAPSDWTGLALLVSGGTFLYVATVMLSPGGHSPDHAGNDMLPAHRVLLISGGMLLPYVISHVILPEVH
ncbi:unnamed protein product [Mycena citricolor]|uniref:2-oxoisovalerate dehydrogenase subunit alpha n=1 Tax=Mycena citricolor TaxID=2018698 RepID=A0AAD2HZG5_9AGAR|nr:unnamed protein product [Mycena citricolor]